MSPIVALKTAIRAALLADAPLSALLGGAKVHDDAPRGEATPYVAFGDATCRDNGAVADAGHVTEMTLFVWSRQGGSREALDIADKVAGLLEEAALVLTGHRTINCRVVSTEVRRQPEKDLTRAALRLRIVTEVL